MPAHGHSIPPYKNKALKSIFEGMLRTNQIAFNDTATSLFKNTFYTGSLRV
jgi:hypothetical protein